MFVEIAQLYEFLSSGVVRLLFLVALLNISVLLFLRRASEKKGEAFQGDFSAPYEVIIPLYRENPEVFEQTLRSILEQSVKPECITVVCDMDEDERIFELCKKYGAKVIASPEHLCKKDAIIVGIRNSKCPFILQIDSDVRLHKNTVEELFKAMKDERVGSVSPKNIIWKNSNNFSERYSVVIEEGRHIVNSALTPHLAVVDGRGALYRREALMDCIDEWESDRFRGKRVIKGEDGVLTDLLHVKGWKTVYQPGAILEIMPPKDVRSLVKQQIRWSQAGYLFFFRRFWKGWTKNKPLLWHFHQATYFMLPLLLLVALLYDLFFTPQLRFSHWLFAFNCLLILPFGLGLWTLARKYIMKLPIRLKDAIPFGLFGFFVMFPLMLYSFFTCTSVEKWGARASWRPGDDGSRGFAPLYAFLLFFALFSVVGSAVLLYAASQRTVIY